MRKTSGTSEFQVNAKSGHPHRPAVTVVSRIVDVLKIDPAENAMPEMRIVVALDDGLSAVGQSPISQQKAASTKFKIALVVRRDSIGDERGPNFILFAPPTVAREIRAQFDRLVYLGVRV
jgi:hypothetical protein